MTSNYRTQEEIKEGFEIYDNSFESMLPKNPKLVQCVTGMGWAEGPVYFDKGDYVLCSDIPNNRIIKWSKSKGMSIFRYPSEYSNGNFKDIEGRLVSCQHGTRNITRTEKDGTITNLIDNYKGQKLNSPNDLVVDSLGNIFFTDPPYGIISDRFGHKAESELGKNYVFQYDIKTKQLNIIADDFDKPNGLCFSPDERFLYVADSGEPGHIRRLELTDTKQIKSSSVFAIIRPGIPDGFRVDKNGNIFTSAWDGIQVYNPHGNLIGKILVPEDRTANCCFGGKSKNILFIAADRSLYSILLNTTGV